MTTYSGALAEAVILTESLYGATSGATQTVVPPSQPAGWFDNSATMLVGGQTRLNQIVEINRDDLAVYPGGVNSAFYFRILVEPSSLDLGNIVSSQVNNVIIWNGYFETKTIDSIGEAGTAGIEITGPATPPFDIGPLAVINYQIVVTTDGPANIDASYTFVVEGVEYKLTITGSRVTLWPFGPNWSEPVSEQLEWMTDVIRTYNGNEQRISLRSLPRRRLEYRFSVFGKETQRYDNILWGWQNRAFALPMWQYGGKTTAPIAIGENIVPVLVSSVGFAVGGLGVLYKSPSEYEVFEVQVIEVGEDSLQTKLELTRNWPAGTLVYPAVTAFVEGNVATKRETTDKLIGNIRFLAEPVKNDPFAPTVAATDLYKSTEIILKQPDWQGGIETPSDYFADLVDFQTGAAQKSPTNDTPILYRRYAWLLKTRAEVETFRVFLQRLKGRAKAVYIPSWTEDYELAQPILLNDSLVRFVDRLHFNLVGLDNARRDIMIRKRDGSFVVRRAQSIGLTAGVVEYGLDEQIPFAVSLSEFKSAHNVNLWRLSSDAVEIAWYTNQVARVEVQFQLVKA